VVDHLHEYLDIGVFGILGLMSFLVAWFAIERLLFYRHVDLHVYHNPDALNIALTHNLTTLSSVGTNAPYVGLLGTVLGILITFYDMGQRGSIDTQAVMLGLALALKATALGLVVAIPAIVIYNGLLRKVDELTAQWKIEVER
jgi:biopolymer transport protein ExbB